MESESSSMNNHFEAIKASMGSHFQFKSEKEWQSFNMPITSKFTLNLKSLNDDLSTILFYERQQLPKEMFSEDELVAMDKETQMCSDQRTYTKSKPHQTTRVEKVDHNTPNTSAVLAEAQNDKKSLKINETNKQTDDLEDWLNSVLDD